jgi:hypothetical protein
MAMATSFGFNNKAASSTRTTTLCDPGVLENYALVLDEPTECRLINTTAAVDREEILSYRAKDMNKINTNLNVQNPAPVAGGIQYQVQLEAILTTEDTTTGFRVDEPIVVQISVRHPKSGNITPYHVSEMIQRAISLMQTDSGNWRIKELMRSSLKPTTD